MQDLRDQHRQLRRLDRQQQGRDDDADQRARGRQPLVAHGVNQHARGELADQRRHGAQGQGETDLHLGPFICRKINRHERPKPRLHIRHEEIDQIKRSAATGPQECKTLLHAFNEMMGPATLAPGTLGPGVMGTGMMGTGTVGPNRSG